MADVVRIEGGCENYEKEISTCRTKKIAVIDTLSRAPLERRLVLSPGRMVVILRLSNAGIKDSTCVLPSYPVIAISTSKTQFTM